MIKKASKNNNSGGSISGKENNDLVKI